MNVLPLEGNSQGQVDASCKITITITITIKITIIITKTISMVRLVLPAKEDETKTRQWFS